MSSATRITGAILAFSALPAMGVAFATAASADPADMLQQVAVPASGNCADITDVTLNRAGVSSGGWSKSWAAWVSPPLGGPVCTRTLYWNNSTGKWDRR